MIFFSRKAKYETAIKAADDVRRTTADLRRAIREHGEAVEGLLGELIPARGGAEKDGDNDVSTSE